MAKVYVVHGVSGNVYGVLTDYSRAEACKALAHKQEEGLILPWDEFPDQLVFIAEQTLDQPSIGGC